MPADHDVEFGTLTEDGGYTVNRRIPQSAMLACPHFIMVAEHYRDDNTCRCNDPAASVMAEWGYVWADGLGWVNPPDEDDE